MQMQFAKGLYFLSPQDPGEHPAGRVRVVERHAVGADGGAEAAAQGAAAGRARRGAERGGAGRDPLRVRRAREGARARAWYARATPLPLS